MKLWFAWLGKIKDQGGKIHIWGVLEVHDLKPQKKLAWYEEPITTSRFIVRCVIVENSVIDVKLEERGISVARAFDWKNRRLSDGYKEITQVYLERKYPQILTDIEMQLSMMRLVDEI